MNKLIAIDFDGTLFITDWPTIIEPNWEIINKAKAEKENRAKLILWTCRCGKYLDDAIEACRRVGIIFDAVNENLPESIEMFDGTNSRKVFANEYWDDLSLNPTYDVFWLYKYNAPPSSEHNVEMSLS